MKFYVVDNHSWFATLKDAHTKGKETDPSYRAEVRIREVDVITTKEGVLHLLQRAGHPLTLIDGPQRTWTLTARGGLKEITEGVTVSAETVE